MANTHSLDLEETSDQYAESANTTLTDGYAAMTIQGWWKPEANLDNYNNFINKRSGATISWGFQYENDSDKFTFSEGGGKSAITTNAQSISAGTWYHIAVVYDGSQADADKVVFVIDGVEVATTVDASFPTTLPSNEVPIRIGNAAGSNEVDGLVDDWRIYNSARTATAIDADRSTEVSSGPVAYWKLNEDYTDLIGSLDLTASGSPVFSTDVPFTGAGSVKRVIIF